MRGQPSGTDSLAAVEPRAHGHADIGGGDDRCVVDPVADHHHRADGVPPHRVATVGRPLRDEQLR
jgi:hypothetical protein